MPLTISLQFPAGRYVAASWTNRDAVEWPPHPARLTLGLIDALHRSGNPPDLREAFEQLCSLDPPEIVIPAGELAPEMPMDGYFVPQNPAVAEQLIHHPRKGRSFPSICLDPDQPTVFFHWPEVALKTVTINSLHKLVVSLPRLGHSQSLVVANARPEPPPTGDDWQRLLPKPHDFSGTPDHALRVPYSDLLQAAEAAFQEKDRTEEMQRLITASARRATPDKPLKPKASSHNRYDPPARWQGYVIEQSQPAPETPWDSRILILKRAGDRLDLPCTWQLTSTLHQTLLDRWERVHLGEPIPEWLSGHRSGKPGESTAPVKACHLAGFPLPNVGFEHSNGNLLGVGLALPKPADLGIDRATFRLQWRKALAALLPGHHRQRLRPTRSSRTGNHRRLPPLATQRRSTRLPLRGPRTPSRTPSPFPHSRHPALLRAHSRTTPPRGRSLSGLRPLRPLP